MPAPDKNSRKFLRMARIVLALTIVAWLANRVGAEAVLEQLSRVELPLLLLALVLMTLDNVAKAWNWQQLLDAMVTDRHVPFRRVASWHFAGGFLGAVVPSSASTDAFRAVLGQQSLGGHGPECAASVLTTNGFGWLTGCVIGLLGVGLLALGQHLPTTLGSAAVLFLGMLIALPVGYMLLASHRERLTAVLEGGRFPRIARVARKFLEALFVFERAHVRLPALLSVSATGLLAQAGMYALTAASIGVHLPFAVWMVLAPLTRIVALVPISIADLGLIQAAHVYVLSLFGVPPWQAFVISTLFALQGLVIHATVGGAAFALGGARVERFIAKSQRI